MKVVLDYSLDVIMVNPPTVDQPNPKTVVILPPASDPPLSDDTDVSATPADAANFRLMPEGGSVLLHDALTYVTDLMKTLQKAHINMRFARVKRLRAVLLVIVIVLLQLL